MEDFDPYHKWLGIPKNEQPPNHYRLLGVTLFEADLDVIEAAADRQMAYLKQCATGPHLALSQKLLNELATARVNLLVPAKKQAYDKKLRLQMDEEALIEQSLTPVKLFESESKPKTDSITAGFKQAPKRSNQAPALPLRTRTTNGKRKGRPSPTMRWVNGITAAIVCLIMFLGLLPAVIRRGGPSSNVTPAPSQPESGPGNPRVPQEVAAIQPAKPIPPADEAGDTSSMSDAATVETNDAKRKSKSVRAQDSDQSFVVLGAKYGVRDKWVDLSSRIEDAATSGVVGVIVRNSLVGRDPLFGVPKQFTLRYSLHGRQICDSFRDQSSIAVIDTRQAPDLDPQGRLVIHDAMYGREIMGEPRWKDVSDELRQRISNDAVSVPVRDAVGAAGNADGSNAVIVRWSCRGRWWTSAFDDQDTIRLGTATMTIQRIDQKRRSDTDEESDLVIDEVTFGAKGKFADLTDRIHQAAQSGFVAIVANMLLLKEDPVPGTTKQLRIRYRLFGHSFDELYGENSMILIDSRQPAASELGDKLKILSAYCGNGISGEGKLIDVTEHLQSLVHRNETNRTMQDAMAAVAGQISLKWLIVKYTVGCEIHTSVFDREDPLTFGQNTE